MSKHSPAPWTFSAVSEQVIAADGETVVWESGTNEADNYLIAAAPELLAALIAAVDCGMLPISSAKEGGAVTHSIQVRVADQIRDAIKKAQGESN